MNTFQILFSVFLILWKCKGFVIYSASLWSEHFVSTGAAVAELTMQNVIFQNTKKTWKDAANVCASTGGVLESNVTFLRDLHEFKIADDDVWIGKFRTLINWTYIRGCYLIHGKFQHFELELSNPAELQCQILCEKYKFHSIKGADCYCIANTSSFVRSTDCNCDGCYKVWDHRLPNFGEAKEKGCIVTIKCEPKIFGFERGYEECSKQYYVTCDNGIQLGKTFTHDTAVAECEHLGSFIKWHPDNLCNSTDFPQHWTSGTRHDQTSIVRKAYLTEKLQPDECFILKKEGTEDDEDNCNKNKFFFCRIDTDEDNGDMVTIPNIWISPQKNVQVDDSGSIAAGIVTSIIVVIAVISVLVFIHRRRLFRKKPTLHESQNSSRLQVGVPSNYETSKSPVYHEIDAVNCSRAVNNKTYDQAPNSQNLSQSAKISILTNVNSNEHRIKISHDGYEMAKVINENGKSSEGANSSNYCLAKPITSTTEEDSDPYDINKDYDHLNNVKKREDPITKVYDHLPTTITDDPTYDHSNLKSALDNEDYYDHFKNEEDND